jgi:transcriptional regulator with XRE-family HTH domain
VSWAGNLIKQARLTAGLSQRELARRAGTSQATLSAYERGEKSPSVDTLARVVRSAGLDLRISIAEAETHDAWVTRYEEALPKRERERRNKRDLRVINTARRERGLPPVSQDDLVGA